LAWPGNVRQVENVCRWLTVMASGREVLIDDLPPELKREEPLPDAGGGWEKGLGLWADRAVTSGGRGVVGGARRAYERAMIEVALKHTGGRRRDAAGVLGWVRNALTRKIKELGMEDAVAADGED